MKRMVALIALVCFLVYTGVYIFVYLFRAFRLPEAAGAPRQVTDLAGLAEPPPHVVVPRRRM